ncbi:hypothetical protein [Rubricoccus marinus]|uniref:hypothetical protein n=1 Tax=Rubricoccus marinus TaxID=716817 RepID=UPI00117BDD4A|nr:hypothetical protein [Rubricoccus marinus]
MKLSFPNVFSALGAVAGVSRAIYWGDCPHCARPTPWRTNPLRGEYHCTACGRDALTSEASGGTRGAE